jgi:hypothetical protein
MLMDKNPLSLIDFDCDYYDILGVCREDLPAGPGAEVRRELASLLQRAYREKVFENHPDRGGDPEAFKCVVRAHSVLSDPSLRRIYDAGPGEKQEGGPEFRVDWSRFGHYCRGSLADQVGTTLFLATLAESGIPGICEKYAPTDEEYHNYHWGFRIPDVGADLTLSLVDDADEVLALTDGEQEADQSLPFKVYFHFPSVRLAIQRDPHPDNPEVHVITGAIPVDADLLSTTDYEAAIGFIRGGGLAELVARFVDGDVDQFLPEFARSG